MLNFIHWKFLKIFCPGVRKRIFNNVNMQWNLLGWHPFELKWNRKTSKIFWGYWALEQEECICRENNKEEFILLGSILKRSYWVRQRSQNLNKSSGLFFRLLCPSFCSVCPQIVEHVDWMEEKQQITSCSKQIHCILVRDLCRDTIQIQYILGTSHVPISMLVSHIYVILFNFF